MYIIITIILLAGLLGAAVLANHSLKNSNSWIVQYFLRDLLIGVMFFSFKEIKKRGRELDKNAKRAIVLRVVELTHEKILPLLFTQRWMPEPVRGWLQSKITPEFLADAVEYAYVQFGRSGKSHWDKFISLVEADTGMELGDNDI